MMQVVGAKLAYDVMHQCLLCFGHGGYDRGPMEQRLRDVLGFRSATARRRS